MFGQFYKAVDCVSKGREYLLSKGFEDKKVIFDPTAAISIGNDKYILGQSIQREDLCRLIENIVDNEGKYLPPNGIDLNRDGLLQLHMISGNMSARLYVSNFHPKINGEFYAVRHNIKVRSDNGLQFRDIMELQKICDQLTEKIAQPKDIFYQLEEK